MGPRRQPGLGSDILLDFSIYQGQRMGEAGVCTCGHTLGQCQYEGKFCFVPAHQCAQGMRAWVGMLSDFPKVGVARVDFVTLLKRNGLPDGLALYQGGV